MFEIPSTPAQQSAPIVMTPLSAAGMALGLRQALEQGGWMVIATADPGSYAKSALACIVIMSPQTIWDPQAATAMSAGFPALIPVITEPMSVPQVQWASTPFLLGASDAQQQATGVAIAMKLAQLFPTTPLETPMATAPTAPTPPAVFAPPQTAPAAVAYPAVTSPTAAPMLASGQYGALVKDFPGSAIRYGMFLLAALGVWGIFASLAQSSLPGLVFWLAIAASSLVYFYYRLRNVRGQVFERGFAITRGDRTVGGRWEDIAQVTHRVTTTRMYFIIPVSRSHTFTITLRSGERTQVTSAFSNATQLGEIIQRMWAQTSARARAQQP
jgi:hypothetical protein